MTDSSRCYHHGNLRDALILATAELIEESGSTAFSITDAARRAGVSNAAPYRHFRDKEDLLDNVRDLAFMGLHERLEKTPPAPGAQAGTVAAVTAMGLTYLQYARDKRAFFALMWEDRGQMQPERQNLPHKREGFDLLLTAIETYLVQTEIQSELSGLNPRAIRIATQLWAIAHGIATLEQNQLLDLFDKTAQAEQVLIESTEGLLSGLVPDAAAPSGH